MERRDRGYLQSFPSPQYGSEFLFLFLFLIFFAEAFYMRVIHSAPPQFRRWTTAISHLFSSSPSSSVLKPPQPSSSPSKPHRRAEGRTDDDVAAFIKRAIALPSSSSFFAVSFSP